MKDSTRVVYQSNNNAWEQYPDFIASLVERDSLQRLCDVGGGANPTLALDFVEKHRIEYTVLDISSAEAQKLPHGYKILIQDIESPAFSIQERFDFVFSRMLAEHVRSARMFHRNIFVALKAGGLAVHYFPTLYALPFVVNKLVPNSMSSYLLNIFAPRDRNKLGKFPAYYDWCYGPIARMLTMLKSIGFEILEFRGLIGHSYYQRIPLIRTIHNAYSSYLLKHPNPYLTSFAQVVLRKPRASS